MAFASQKDGGGTRLLAAGFGYAAVLYAANILHSVGHVIAGRVVGAPVEVVLVTSTRDVMVYTQPGTAAPTRSRLGRALGGPAANLAVGCVLTLAGHVTEASWVVVAGLMNVGIAIWTLMPVPSLDGWVIWSILTRSRGGGTA
jgi:membrane-associated protease RseP (regulator of RpoE activity)